MFHEASPDEQNEILRRAEALDTASAECEIAVEGPITLGGEEILHGSGSWLAPVQLATDEEMPLWSDDVVVRRIARGAAVAALGTLTLVQALVERDGDLPAEEFDRLRPLRSPSGLSTPPGRSMRSSSGLAGRTSRWLRSSESWPALVDSSTKTNGRQRSMPSWSPNRAARTCTGSGSTRLRLVTSSSRKRLP